MAKLWNGRMSDQGGFWLCLIMGLGLTIGCIIWYASMHFSLAEAKSWPSTNGEVVATDIEVHSRKRTSYLPQVRYRYTVGGTVHEGDKIQLNDPLIYHTRDEARAFLADYPVGGPVTVYHDPERPALSVLLFDGTYWPALLGIPVGLLVLSCAWYLRGAGVRSPALRSTTPFG